jgi:hypothetical protein
MMGVTWRDTVCAFAIVAAALSCALLITNNARAADYNVRSVSHIRTLDPSDSVVCRRLYDNYKQRYHPRSR